MLKTQDAARPLSSFPLTCTGDAEEIRAAFERVYHRPVMDFAGRNRALHAVINHCRLQHIELNYATYGADLIFQFPESDLTSQIFPLAGKAEAVIDGHSVAMDGRQSAILSAGAPFTIKNGCGYERLIFSVRSDSLGKTLSALTGRTITAPIRMDPERSFGEMGGQLLRKQLMFLVRHINSLMTVRPLLLNEFEYALMVSFLHVNRHNYSHLLEGQVPRAAPAEVRRAEEYIEAHWQEAVTAEDLVAATGVSALSLIRSFKTYRGYSPLQYLERVRFRHRY